MTAVKSNFLIWGQALVEGACSLDSLKGYEDDWELLDGVPVQHRFPRSASFRFDPDDRGKGLTDSLYNMNRLVVASPALRGVIEKSGATELEFLPVSIRDHQKRPVAPKYCIVHPLAPVDCLLVDRCEARWGLIDKTNIDKLKRFVIDESRIPEGRLLFRVKHYNSRVLVHRSLARMIDAAGLTGARWIELADYPKVRRRPPAGS